MMNDGGMKKFFTALTVFLFTFTMGAIAQTLDECQLKCENRYKTQYSQCRGDKLCQDRALDVRNECRHICTQR